jgi:ketosteroid isomerase-like protein
MSQEKEKTVAGLVAAWNERDVDGFLRFFDADCEVVFPPEVPEPGPFRGHVQLREWAEGFLAAWESHRVEVLELIETDDTAVAMLRLTGRGTGSGIAMEETDAHVFEFRGGRIASWRDFGDRSHALEAAGLSK